MPLGYDLETRIAFQGDTADLYAYIYDGADAPITDASAVEFVIQKPSGLRTAPIPGAVLPDGSGFLEYTDTTELGEYLVVATFTLIGGGKKSARADFQITDPFGENLETPIGYAEYPTLNAEDQIAWQVGMIGSRVWAKMEDVFDSTDGGPWMRDMTMNVFNPAKINEFIDEALFTINVYNPPTHFWIDKFATPLGTRPNENLTIIVQGTWVAVIRHLMRSYVEQPLPSGGQVTYEDRRDYLQRWGTMYQIENGLFDQLVKLWKRQFLGLGSSKLLVSNKAGRLLPAPLRTRNIGRGYY